MNGTTQRPTITLTYSDDPKTDLEEGQQWIEESDAYLAWGYEKVTSKNPKSLIGRQYALVKPMGGREKNFEGVLNIEGIISLDNEANSHRPPKWLGEHESFAKFFKVTEIHAIQIPLTDIAYKDGTPFDPLKHRNTGVSLIYIGNNPALNYLKGATQKMNAGNAGEDEDLILLEKAEQAEDEQKLRDKIQQIINTKKRDARFAKKVKEAYDYKCAICGKLRKSIENSHYEVQAAHISAVGDSNVQNDEVPNGLSLCRLHHWAFDEGLFSVTDDYYVLVKSGIKGDPNFDEISCFENAAILLPSNTENYPSSKYLSDHRKKHGFS